MLDHQFVQMNMNFQIHQSKQNEHFLTNLSLTVMLLWKHKKRNENIQILINQEWILTIEFKIKSKNGKNNIKI